MDKVLPSRFFRQVLGSYPGNRVKRVYLKAFRIISDEYCSVTTNKAELKIILAK